MSDGKIIYDYVRRQDEGNGFSRMTLCPSSSGVGYGHFGHVLIISLNLHIDSW